MYSLEGRSHRHRSHRSHGCRGTHHPDLHGHRAAIRAHWRTHRSRRPGPAAPAHGVESGTVAEAHASTPHLSAAATTTLKYSSMRHSSKSSVATITVTLEIDYLSILAAISID